MSIDDLILACRKEFKDSFPDQRSLTDQMRDLMILANVTKMYDAADYIAKKFELVGGNPHFTI
jgi:hypothetical protein